MFCIIIRRSIANTASAIISSFNTDYTKAATKGARKSEDNMSFTGVSFLLFLPIIIAIYFLIPAKVRYIWLLFASYFFYCSQSTSFVSLLIISTIITWVSGKLIYNTNDKTVKKLIILIGVLLNLSILIIFKYADFTLSLVNSSRRLNLILPAGISFYTFQSLTYIFDCYNGDIEPEKNIFRYALFVSFFPLILAGPIERAKNLIPQFNFNVSFNPLAAKDGLKLMLFGYFLKIVIVGRLSILTDTVFSNYSDQSGFAILCAILAYTIQIYCDFAGYSNIAIGMCKVMGINIIKNFNQPYFSTSVADFWRRWHISLSSWFKDYLYIPLGGNRKGKLRKHINVMIVFILSGIWHGANLTFVVWGFLNGIYQVIGDLCKPIKMKLIERTKLDSRPALLRALSTVCTFILIAFTWVFFRANNINEAISILVRMFASFRIRNVFDGTVFTLGLGVANLLFVLFAILIMAITDVICEKKECDPSMLLSATPAVVRWGIYYLLIAMIIFSLNLSTQEFIYQAF